MELTQAQKDLNLPSKWWGDAERQRKHIEYWQAHPLSIEEIMEMLAMRTNAQKYNTWSENGQVRDEIYKVEK